MKTMMHQLPPQKNDTVYKVEKSGRNVNEKVNAYIISTKKKIDTVGKTEKSKNPQNQLLPPRIRR